MKRVLLAGLLTLGFAAPAQAHYLTVPYARGGAVQAARELAAEQGANWYRVATCSRLNDHAVTCGIALTIPTPNGLLACGAGVRIWIRGRSYQRYWSETGARCSY
jgi:hypothetical protein